ncbi:hypothetical protein MOQ_007297 [Trypanosoma cruzi marinkellei]|uniref:Uncharacterized protein n=1 Tax=Trypanosoma cruzi marinkellei TaxID=85056 RepID=K2N2X1_TRYCR|nr:hypothetical protein MOQ_007297 [Trypanosoma cruzi marinkellei]
MQQRCEVHISGVTFSYLVSSVLTLCGAAKRNYSLFGHYEVRESDTDNTENLSVLEAVVNTVLPLGVLPPEGATFLGYVSARRFGPHKLSFEDTKFLLGKKDLFDTQSEKVSSSYPVLLLLVTAHPDASPSNGTSKLEYSVIQSVLPFDSSKCSITNKNVVPLKVNNMVDSLSGFISIGSLGCHNPSDKLHLPFFVNPSRVVEVTFEHSVSEIEDASRKLQVLFQRLTDLKRVLSERKVSH